MASKKIGDGLRKTRESFFKNFGKLFTSSAIDDELYEQIMEQLVLADVGAAVANDIIDELETAVKKQHLKNGEQAYEALKSIIAARLTAEGEFNIGGKPAVILVVGVNGVGKTTSIAKLAALYKAQGKKVLLAAGDTFRAAAAEQLKIWADRVGAPIVTHAEGSDPSSVIFDAVSSAAAKGFDIVICDTAGRLHNKKNLMEELAKISRAVLKASAEASVETLLVIDAITGQNAINQAAEFAPSAGVSGIILTKLDGTAKGGSAISIKAKLGIPVRFIGVGEKVEDIEQFDAAAFANALLGD